MTALEALLVRHVEAGTIPGAVAVLGSGDVAVVAAGVASINGGPMRQDAIMRIQSMTKADHRDRRAAPRRGGLSRARPAVEEWLPELANRRVLSSPTAALDDTVPARRAITLRAPAD